MKSYLLMAASAALVAGIGYTANHSGYGKWMRSVGKEAIESEEEGEAQGIEGALRSIYSMRLNEKTGTLEPEWIQAAIEQANTLRVKNRASKTLTWTNMGPDNVGGRVRALQLHRDSANLWFMGGVSGGLFRSTNSGQTWTPINDNQENLNVNCITQTANGTIYYGTGEGGFTNLSGTRNGSPAFIGNGVYKSTDASGKQFKVIAATVSDGRFQVCNSMASHPTDDKFYVATESGLFVFTNNGSTFSLARGGQCKEVKVDKNGVVWASMGTGQVYKSDNNGSNFAVTNSTANSGGRMSIGISPQDPNYVYLMGSTSGQFAGVWRTTDGGSTWSQVVAKSSVTDMFGSNNQGWYDNVIEADPLNKNRCYMGGVTFATWDNQNGFRELATTFGAQFSTNYIHADKHIIQWNMRTTPPTMLVGTDGGLFRSQDVNTWTPINRDFITFQCYNVAANSLGHVVGGSQDNGTVLINFKGNSVDGKPSRMGFDVYGGDGFDAECSKFSPSVMFFSTYYGVVARSGNAGQSSATFWDNRIKPDETATNPPNSDFNTTFTLWEDSIGRDRLFLAKDGDVWVAINSTDFVNQPNWFLVASGLGNDRIIEMDVTSDGDHLFVCKSGRLYRIDGFNSATFSTTLYPGARTIPLGIATKTITPSQAGGRTVTSANVDPMDDNHVVVTLGGYGNATYVLETKNALDGNPTWKNITGDLPSMPVYDAVVDADDPNRIIIGTDLGVWVTENGGTNWIEANTGMARVPVFEIRGYEWKPWEGMHLYLGTHGRGFYTSKTLLTVGNKTVNKSSVKADVYPSPANRDIQVRFTLSATAKTSVEVYGMNGMRYANRDVQGNAGANSLRMETATLPAGYYFVRITSGKETATVKFAVSR
ncbi:MAG: T9SS type A sorting domain-containing protein [Bacteroidetes bacterium]|nr:T9SS type A sorting domain-containing protein [Bacteroidota bacterium]